MNSSSALQLDCRALEIGGVYDKLDCFHFHRTSEARVVAKSPFCGARHHFLLKSMQKRFLQEKNDQKRLRMHQVTSFCQGAEYSMHCFHSAFQQLKNKLVYELRGDRIKTSPLCHTHV